VPLNTPTRRYYQNINRYSAAFALAADFAMLTLGGKLKQRELLSARLGDVFSSMYLASCVLKHFENQGRRSADLPLVEWSVRTLMYQAQEQLHGFLRNFPNRPVAILLRALIFPRGRTYSSPADELGQKIVDLVITPGEARERLAAQAFRAQVPGSELGLLQETLEMALEVEPIEKKLREMEKEGRIRAEYLPDQVAEAREAGCLGEEEADKLLAYHDKAMAIIHVDDFAPDAFACGKGGSAGKSTGPGGKKKKKKAAKRKRKVARKKAASAPADSGSAEGAETGGSAES